MKYCPSCGNEVNENAIICVKCGTQLSNTTAAGRVNSAAPSGISNIGTLSAAFKSAKTGAFLVLLGNLLIKFFSFIALNYFYEGKHSAYQALSIFSGLMGIIVLAGVIICLIACNKAMKSADLSSINDLSIFTEVFKMIKIGVIIMIAATVIGYIGSFFGTGTFFIMALKYKSEIFVALIGATIRIASYVGMAFAMLGCAKGEKVTKGIN